MKVTELVDALSQKLAAPVPLAVDQAACDRRGIRLHAESPSFYLPPELEPMNGTGADPCFCYLVSAPAAVGKSALANFLIGQLRPRKQHVIYVPLRGAVIGEGFFAGLLADIFPKASKAQTLAELFRGNVLIVFDGYDEVSVTAAQLQLNRLKGRDTRPCVPCPLHENRTTCPGRRCVMGFAPEVAFRTARGEERAPASSSSILTSRRWTSQARETCRRPISRCAGLSPGGSIKRRKGRSDLLSAHPLPLESMAALGRRRGGPMDYRRAEPNHPKTRIRRGSPSAALPEEAAVVDSLQWVTARVPHALVREIEAHAKRTGTTRSDAIRECLGVGIETIRGRDGISRGRVDELLGAIESVRLLLELLGPPTLGTQRLLAHWATRDGKVSEDQLLAEVRSVGADEWEQAVSEAERDLPDAGNLESHDGRS